MPARASALPIFAAVLADDHRVEHPTASGVSQRREVLALADAAGDQETIRSLKLSSALIVEATLVPLESL